MNPATTFQKAYDVLINNTTQLTIDKKVHRYITPSREYYLHHWLWDSAVHAMALAYVDEELARAELESLMLGQWKNGHIGHIRFHPEESGYFPGPEVWKTEDVSTQGIITSGITQPPLIAIAFRHVLSVSENKKETKKFVESYMTKIMRYHDYLMRTRDAEDSGLLTIIHPWESGMDNSPRWDQPMKNIKIDDIPKEVKDLVDRDRTDHIKQDIEERPRKEDYLKYIYLVHQYAEWNWNYEKIVANSPFAMKDISTNIIWCRANTELASLCEELDDKQNAEKFRQISEQTSQALETCWDNETQTFADTDVSQGKKVNIITNSISSIMSFYSCINNEMMLGEVFKKLKDSKQFATPYPVPSLAASDERFDTERYWRGPTWPITNLFIIEGLNSRQQDEYLKERDKLIDKTLRMIETFGCWEYFHPITGKDEKSALGFGDFSWTAAVYIYLKKKYRK